MITTLAAEEVLRDCELAVVFLEQETDRRKFRLFWLAAVAGLRSVGHVLDKVDAQKSTQLRRSIDGAYAGWKCDKEKNKIFWSFI